ncbi:MAG: hypothetical protein RLN81_16960 [Balneolaceae bacterium]
MKRIKTTVFILILLPFLASETNAQVIGLWEVTKVTVGSQERTPIARWSKINPDQTYESGNGWLQNSDGAWEFDSDKMELTMVPKTGYDDPFGPFKVSFIDENVMTWKRVEEGEEVTVYNQRIEMVPKSPSDLVTGIWDLSSAERNGKDALEEFDPSGNRFVFLRPDHLFRDFTKDGRVSGIWKVDAHRPVLDILYYDDSKPLDYWAISFVEENTMVWERDEIKLTFSRLRSFPE